MLLVISEIVVFIIYFLDIDVLCLVEVIMNLMNY